MEKAMQSVASEESAEEKHFKMKRDIAFTVEFLRKFGGSDMHFNQFSNTIIYLDGIYKGMTMADSAHERIASQKQRPESGELKSR